MPSSPDEAGKPPSSLLSWLIEPRDIALLGELSMLAVMSWLLPERSWDPLSHRLAALRQLIRRDLAPRAAHADAILKGRVRADLLGQVLSNLDANTYLERLQLLRVHRPGGWTPRIRLEGGPTIEESLEAGSGVILWVTAFSFHRQCTKMALWDAGYRVTHLSRYNHGFQSFSRFSERCLNPLRTAAESRFLYERLVIERNGATDVLSLLAKRLSRNEIVSITVGSEARRVSAVPFLNGVLELAGGPLHLSYKSGAPLLPVFTVREPDGGFTTTVEPPLNIDRGVNPDEVIAGALRAYVRRLEAYALRYPDQFAWHEVQRESSSL